MYGWLTNGIPPVIVVTAGIAIFLACCLGCRGCRCAKEGPSSAAKIVRRTVVVAAPGVGVDEVKSKFVGVEVSIRPELKE